jgi:hypothetical protein
LLKRHGTGYAFRAFVQAISIKLSSNKKFSPLFHVWLWEKDRVAGAEVAGADSSSLENPLAGHFGMILDIEIGCCLRNTCFAGIKSWNRMYLSSPPEWYSTPCETGHWSYSSQLLDSKTDELHQLRIRVLFVCSWEHCAANVTQW